MSLGMDFKNYHPWMLCIEATEPATENHSYYDWENIVIENGYVYAEKKVC